MIELQYLATGGRHPFDDRIGFATDVQAQQPRTQQLLVAFLGRLGKPHVVFRRDQRFAGGAVADRGQIGPGRHLCPGKPRSRFGADRQRLVDQLFRLVHHVHHQLGVAAQLEQQAKRTLVGPRHDRLVIADNPAQFPRCLQPQRQPGIAIRIRQFQLPDIGQRGQGRLRYPRRLVLGKLQNRPHRFRQRTCVEIDDDAVIAKPIGRIGQNPGRQLRIATELPHRDPRLPDTEGKIVLRHRHPLMWPPGDRRQNQFA